MGADERPEQLDLFADDLAATPGGLAAARSAAAAQRGEAPTSGPNGEPLVRCRACNALMYWRLNPATGKRSPVSLATRESHFADCPDAALFRRHKRHTKGKGEG